MKTKFPIATKLKEDFLFNIDEDSMYDLLDKIIHHDLAVSNHVTIDLKESKLKRHAHILIKFLTELKYKTHLIGNDNILIIYI